MAQGESIAKTRNGWKRQMTNQKARCVRGKIQEKGGRRIGKAQHQTRGGRHKKARGKSTGGETKQKNGDEEGTSRAVGGKQKRKGTAKVESRTREVARKAQQQQGGTSAIEEEIAARR